MRDARMRAPGPACQSSEAKVTGQKKWACRRGARRYLIIIKIRLPQPHAPRAPRRSPTKRTASPVIFRICPLGGFRSHVKQCASTVPVCQPNRPTDEMVRMVTCSLLVALLLATANAFVPSKPCSRAKSSLRVVPPVVISPVGIKKGAQGKKGVKKGVKKGAQGKTPMQGKKEVRSARTDPTLSHAHRPPWRLRPCARGPTLPHAHRIPGASACSTTP